MHLDLNSTNLSLFLEQIQGPLPNHSQHTKRPNFTSQQRFTLKNLGTNLDLLIKPFDRDSRICVIKTFLYINKTEEHLADATTYKKLNTDPTQAIGNDVFSTLDYLHNTHQIDDTAQNMKFPI